MLDRDGPFSKLLPISQHFLSFPSDHRCNLFCVFPPLFEVQPKETREVSNTTPRCLSDLAQFFSEGSVSFISFFLSDHLLSSFWPFAIVDELVAQ